MFRQLIVLSVIAFGFPSALMAEEQKKREQAKPAQKEEVKAPAPTQPTQPAAQAPPVASPKVEKPKPKPQPFNADRVNKVGRGRYRVSTFEVVKADVFTQPEYNGKPEMLDGYGKGTAEKLGSAGEEVYNEYPGQGAVRVILHPKAVLYYDTASRQPLYLDGCLRKGKPWVNRIKLVEPPPPPEAPALPPPPPPPPVPTVVEKPCPPCPECPPPPKCDPDWSWGVIGEYMPKHSKAKKVRLEAERFITFPQDAALRQEIARAIIAADPEFFRRKVQFAAALYNKCDTRARLYWYREGWHWKEFILGAGIGAAAGSLLTYWLKDCPPVKGDFFNPGNLARPMSGPIGLVAEPLADSGSAPVAAQIGKWSGRLLVRVLQ